MINAKKIKQLYYPETFVEDRTIKTTDKKPEYLLRASCMGRCLRSQVLYSIGYRPSRTLTLGCLLDFGSVVHEHIQNAFSLMYDCKIEQPVFTTIGKITLRATIDIVLENRGYEIKTYGFKNNYALTEENKDKYWMYQLETEHRLSNLEMVMTTTGRAFPIGKLEYEIYVPNDKLWNDIILQIARINSHINRATLPERSMGECMECGFSRLCAQYDSGSFNPYGDVPDWVVKVGSEKEKTSLQCYTS
jgi:hypothetical protein